MAVVIAVLYFCAISLFSYVFNLLQASKETYVRQLRPVPEFFWVIIRKKFSQNTSISKKNIIYLSRYGPLTVFYPPYAIPNRIKNQRCCFQCVPFETNVFFNMVSLFKFFINEKNVTLISSGRKCKDGFICFWLPQPGNVALLPLLVRLVTGAATNLISKPLQRIHVRVISYSPS